MSHENSLNARRISMRDAADLIGKRFHHDDWSSTDTAMLEHSIEDTSDREAWCRAHHVQEELTAYIADGWVRAYTTTEDDVSFTDLPVAWASNPSFAIRVHTGCFMVYSDCWEPLLIDGPELLEVLPNNAQPRKKHTYEWDKVVHEGWMFALRQQSIPAKADVVSHLGTWCSENRQGVPDGSQLSKVAKTIVDFLTQNKTGWEDLKSESCEARRKM